MSELKILRDAIYADSVIRPKRYELRPEQEDYAEIFDAYESVYEWIENKFF